MQKKPGPSGFVPLIKTKKDDKLPKPNYQHDKRQRELEKKKKKEEKRLRKQTSEKPEDEANPSPEIEQPS